tara:strand:+ start:131 stop:415 length:285 start_codon:yes stop_codon:yes gene_type:complete
METSQEVVTLKLKDWEYFQTCKEAYDVTDGLIVKVMVHKRIARSTRQDHQVVLTLAVDPDQPVNDYNLGWLTGLIQGVLAERDTTQEAFLGLCP